MGQEFAAKGNEVIHIGKQHNEQPVTEVKNKVTYTRVKGYDTPSSLLKLKWLDLLYTIRAIRKIPKDADIIITNTFWAPLLIRGKAGKKLYVDVQRVPKGQMKFYQHVGILRACSPAIYEAIIKELPATSHSLVSYIPNPVPFDVKPLQVPKEKIILFVGRLHPEKGVDVLIQSFRLLSESFKEEWILLIVGPHEVKDGGGGEEYYQKLKQMAAGLHVKFVGPVFDENELINYYAGASIFCYPAQDGSGDAAPVAPREAMAYGAVPVVSQLACFNDFIKNEVNGLTFNQQEATQAELLANALKRLMESQRFLGELAEEGKLVNKTYASPVVAQQFLKDFSKISFTNHQ
jgi:glycosyltransferase involved in cell wall biosynthesis